jgi:multidrug efflux pump subunit AcrA (membrane-fusion protein)
MKGRMGRLVVIGLVVAGASGRVGAQNPGVPPGSAATSNVRIERAVLALSAPDRYQIPVRLEPMRRLVLKAPADGIVQALPARLGDAVRERQDVVVLDRAEALARLKIAQADLRAQESRVQTGGGGAAQVQTQAELEAAQARVELAQLAADRCALRAPYPALVIDLPASVGQYVAKGEVVAELADVSRLRAFVPIPRGAVKAGDAFPLAVDGASLPGKVEALLPLPERYAALGELVTPWALAMVTVENPGGPGGLPGQRVRDPFLPEAPIAAVPARAVRGIPGGGVVQVLRNQYVADVPVLVLGPIASERLQVAGPFRVEDTLIVESSAPLLAGTLVRFTGEGGGGVELLPPDPAMRGQTANVRGGPGVAGTGPASRIEAIGQPAAATGGAAAKPAARPAASPKPATPPGNAVPF